MHKILIVDDNSTMRQILKLYMMGKMHTFLEADSAQRAFEILEQESVDLLIVDIHLGRIDGVEFVRMLREKDASARDVPVVFIRPDRLKPHAFDSPLDTDPAPAVVAPPSAD